MDNTEFLSKTSEEKIIEIVSRVKDSIMQGEEITPAFYLFDEQSRLRVIEIKDQLLLKKDRQGILAQLVKEKIREFKNIDKVLFLREGYYNTRHPDKNNMNLDEDFNKSNGNDALLVSIEDEYNFMLKIYDLIKIYDEGKKFSVLSSNPIEELEFCKIDPDCNVKTTYINLI